MFGFSTDKSKEDAFILKEWPDEDGAVAYFGVRPCDGMAFDILDKVFLEQGKSEDSFYQKKRERLFLIGLGCNAPCSTCFCNSVGGGPFSKKGLDVLLTETDGGYVIEPVTEKGEAFLSSSGFADASSEDLNEAKKTAEAALESMGEPLNPRKIKERALLEVFDDAYWDAAHESCIKCGTCTYLCPTCTCFDIQDEVNGSCGFRGRNWDTCMFSLTTLHASGHNPRPTGKERFRQRFMHKLKYFQDDFDTLMCVGCGRCVQHCPVNIDIREIIAAIGA